MCGFDGAQRGNYLRGMPIRRTEREVRVGKAAGKDGEMVKGEDDCAIWPWRVV